MASYSLRPRDPNTSYSILPPHMEVNTQSLNTKPSITRKNHITKSHLPARRLPPVQQKPGESHLRLPKAPLFSPYHHPFPLHHAYNTFPASLLSQDVIDPRHIMDLFLPARFLTLLVQNKNNYAAQKQSENAANRKGEGRARSWSLVSVPELRVWFGIIIYMEVV